MVPAEGRRWEQRDLSGGQEERNSPCASTEKKTIHPKSKPATSGSFFLSFHQWSEYPGDEFLLKPRNSRTCKLEHRWFHNGANRRKIYSLLEKGSLKKFLLKWLTKVVQIRVTVTDLQYCTGDAKATKPHLHHSQSPSASLPTPAHLLMHGP